MHHKDTTVIESWFVITCGNGSTVGLAAGAADIYIQLIFWLGRRGGGRVTTQLIAGTTGAME